MKRILIIAATMVALSACNNSNNETNAASANSTAQTATETTTETTTETSSQTSSAFEAGTHFQVVSDTTTAKDEVRLYFSYNCGHCRTFDPVFNDAAKVLDSAAPSITVEHTHVEFVGRNGADMTWARSMGAVLKVEETVSPLIFSAIHDDNRSLNRSDIRQIFLSAGADAQEFDAAAESFVVQGLQSQQQKQATDAQIRGVPTVLVNGKYMINRGSVSTPAQLAELVQYVAELD